LKMIGCINEAITPKLLLGVFENKVFETNLNSTYQRLKNLKKKHFF
jgi:hypothetical protein